MATALIDWKSTTSTLHTLLEQNGGLELAWNKASSAAPPYRNRTFDPVVSPMILHADSWGRIAVQVEAYHAVLEKVVRLYRSNPEVRAFFGLRAEEESLVLSEAPRERFISICRLDGYLDRSAGVLRVLENNADAPAGTLFTQRLNNLVSECLQNLGGQSCQPSPMDVGGSFAEFLLGEYRILGGVQIHPRVAVLQPKGRSNLESIELAKEFRCLGIRADVLDPRDLVADDGWLLHEGERVDLVWNKINTAQWIELVEQSPELPATMAGIGGGKGTVHLNSFGSRFVAESKFSLAFLQEEIGSALLTDEERGLVAKLLPWSRLVRKGRRVAFEGREWDVAELARSYQTRFVLKKAYDIRGDGVTIGPDVSSSEWNASLEEALEEGGVIQEFFEPCSMPVMVMADTPRVESRRVSLDCFLFGGSLVGFGSKASVNAKINVFQGGSKLPVLLARNARK